MLPLSLLGHESNCSLLAKMIFNKDTLISDLFFSQINKSFEDYKGKDIVKISCSPRSLRAQFLKGASPAVWSVLTNTLNTFCSTSLRYFASLKARYLILSETCSYCFNVAISLLLFADKGKIIMQQVFRIMSLRIWTCLQISHFKCFHSK